MIVLGLGSNLNSNNITREGNIAAAIDLLGNNSQISVEQVSSLYETEPVGFKDQPSFLNAVVAIATELSPIELLTICLSIEIQMGRVREVRWGPRNIDIDLLVYHDKQMITQALELPHPRLPDRRFVLIPLVEIAGNQPIYNGLSAKELLASTKDDSEVTLYGKLDLSGQGKKFD